MSCKYPITLFTAVLCLAAQHLPAQQSVDPAFDSTVPSPAYRTSHPRVAIDQAHFNLHTADGLYRPLAELLRHDGYEVGAGTETFSAATLGSLQVLIIANARGGAGGSATVGSPAFTDAECDAVRDWVRRGGALLLIADHVPFGAAAAPLADRFGVSMGLGHVIDARHSVIDPTLLLYTRANGLLGEHPVLSGRNAGERVRRVVAFDGQSLSVPRGATVLMQLGKSAWEVGLPAELDAAVDAVRRGHSPQAVAPSATSVGGRAQGVALTFGEGRLIVMGEAAMFSAQILKQAGEPDFKFGMNRPGNDDRQFALNALHWLSRAH